ncbi:signal peptidase II [Sandarakinorhabdus rubra]|uniref:signal peptidase II n=1 Tax=Sandarakinorhabdus rubra TaxID=2672568 RepID=UPI0013D8E669|nr:signal peptidase II [Sandarakinorhabdus rubra]
MPEGSSPRGYVIAAAVLLADQASKYWVLELIRLPERGGIDVLAFFRLTFVANAGVSMGLLQAGSDLARWLLTFITAGIALAVALWLRREKHPVDIAALGLVLGGAIGNIIDRVRFGHVVDFLHFFWQQHSFWVFNVADAAITLGVMLLLGRAMTARAEPSHKESKDA